MKRKYNEKFAGVFAYLANKYDFDPLLPRIAFLIAIFGLPAIGLALVFTYMLADLFVVDNTQYDDEE